METAFITLTIVYAVILVADLIILGKYCDAGYMGYPDEWHSAKAEKVHYALGTAMIVLTVIVCVLGIILSITTKS